MIRPVSCVRFSADGKYLAIGSGREALIYYAETSLQLWFSSLRNGWADGTLDTDWSFQPLG